MKFQSPHNFQTVLDTVEEQDCQVIQEEKCETKYETTYEKKCETVYDNKVVMVNVRLGLMILLIV